jgi:single-stranded DNA-binding protein
MSTTRSILMNDVTIVGNLTADPVYRVAERNARGVVRFDVAVNRRRFDRDSNQYVDLPPVYQGATTGST